MNDLYEKISPQDDVRGKCIPDGSLDSWGSDGPLLRMSSVIDSQQMLNQFSFELQSTHHVVALAQGHSLKNTIYTS